MGLEVATTIDQLVPTNPDGTDSRAMGDDHIRLIKGALKNTFPAVTAPVTVSAAQLNAVGSPGAINFPGMIVMWSGTVAAIPSGWKLCNGVGTISTGGAVPNLANRFIVASGGDSGFTFNTNQTGGSNTHSHGVTVAGTALNVSQLPPHSHNFTIYRANGANLVGLPGTASDVDSSFTATTTSTGSGATHTHAASTDGQYNIPVYFALAFLIKN